jgi:hypothetical protein
MTDIQPDYTPFLNLVRPDTHDDIDTTVNKIRDAMDLLDAWAQAHAAGGGLSFHRQVEAETTYTIPDGSDYFVLVEDWSNETVLPAAAPGRVVYVTSIHMPRFGGGNVIVRRPDSAAFNPDDATTSYIISIGFTLTFLSDGIDWWKVASS